MAAVAHLLALLALQAPPLDNAPAVHLCELVSEAAAREGGPSRLVWTTAMLADEVHGGLHLDWWPRCQGSVSNVGLVGLSFPRDFDYSELDRYSDADFRAASVGKRVYCTCIGEISYPHGYPRFVLLRVVRIWASDDRPERVFRSAVRRRRG